MKSKKRDREPELIQYRIEFSIEEDLPAERFLMALTLTMPFHNLPLCVSKTRLLRT